MHRGGGGDKSETKAYSLLVIMSRIGSSRGIRSDRMGWDGR